MHLLPLREASVTTGGEEAPAPSTATTSLSVPIRNSERAPAPPSPQWELGPAWSQQQEAKTKPQHYTNPSMRERRECPERAFREQNAESPGSLYSVLIGTGASAWLGETSRRPSKRQRHYVEECSSPERAASKNSRAREWPRQSHSRAEPQPC